MPHPDHERYRDKRLRILSANDADRRIDQVTRRRQTPIEEPQYQTGIYAHGLELPPLFSKGDGAQVFTFTSSTGYARYIGRAVPRLREVDVFYRVTTIAATVTYAEIGLCISEEPVAAAGLGDTTLTMVGPNAWVDISGPVTSTGRKLAQITDFQAPNPGSYLWLLMVQQATTPAIMRGGIPQEAGAMMSKAGSARPSVLVDNAAFSEVATSVNDLWLPFIMYQGPAV